MDMLEKHYRPHLGRVEVMRDSSVTARSRFWESWSWVCMLEGERGQTRSSHSWGGTWGEKSRALSRVDDFEKDVSPTPALVCPTRADDSRAICGGPQKTAAIILPALPPLARGSNPRLLSFILRAWVMMRRGEAFKSKEPFPPPAALFLPALPLHEPLWPPRFARSPSRSPTP